MKFYVGTFSTTIEVIVMDFFEYFFPYSFDEKTLGLKISAFCDLSSVS